MRPLLSSIALLCLFVLPLVAQEEALHGTWEGTFTDDEIGEGTMRLTFQADGTFDLDLFVAEPIGIPADGEVPDELSDEWTEVMEIFSALERISAHGTYQVTGDHLRVHSNDDEVAYLVDGESVEPVEFWAPVFRFFARLVAVLAAAFGEEIPAEDYEAFEQGLVDEFLAELDEEPLGLGLTLSGTYAIEDDTLFITTTTDVDGVETVETVEFHRLDVASSVAPTSWGALKAAWRP